MTAADLEALADHYVTAMTSIRKRRVRRFIVRAFGAAERIVEASIDERPYLVAALTEGAMIAFTSDGRGRFLELRRWTAAAPETIRYDLLKDSLPVVDVRYEDASELPSALRDKVFAALGRH